MILEGFFRESFREFFFYSENCSRHVFLGVSGFFCFYLCIANERKRGLAVLFEALPRKPLALGRAQTSLALHSLMRSLTYLHTIYFLSL